MDNVISKISEVENAAASIMDDANAQKKAFAQEIEERTAAFDYDMEAETANRICAMKDRMELDMEAKLSKQKTDAEGSLRDMEQLYEANHKKFVRELFLKMIEE